MVALIVVAAASAQEQPLPEPETFAAEVKEHLATDEGAQAGGYMSSGAAHRKHKVDASGKARRANR